MKILVLLLGLALANPQTTPRMQTPESALAEYLTLINDTKESRE